uniref:Uncharacterized protein n=1 Tax=Phlebotomus papatasi TaxID=29031 RepID=A0A1B0DGC1_PHLPP
MAEKGAAQRQPNLKQLHRERGRVKGRLTRIETYLNSNRELFTQEVLSVHEENLHHIRDDFKAVQKQIYNTIPDEELDTEEAEEDAFDDRMISATAKIRQMLKHITKHTTQSTVFLTTKKNNRFWEIINQYSRFTKLVRVLAYCKRFIHNKFLCKRDNSERITGPLTVYVAVYVCFVTRAVHLELVHDLTSEAFIASLRRFCARRGKPSDIFCDNAKNFVGAAKQISDIHQLLRDEKIQTSISTDSAQQGIRFHFIPPRSPHFGGIWETAVKSFKSHLKRVAGNVVFTLESLETIIVEIEACLNSRPLCPMSNDPQDFTALTPGHFIVGTALNTLPSQDLTHIQQNRLSKWRVNEQILQHFWKRWHREILTSMQQRKKWQQERPNIEKGDLVIIQEDNIPPLKWPLGRVVDVHPGADNRVRVATVQTQDGIYKRAITRLAVLPTGQEGLESEHSPEGAGWT